MKDQRRGSCIVAALLVGLSLLGCDHGQEAPPPPRPVPEVATVTVRSQQVVLTTELPGHTSPYLLAEIRPQVSGLIQKRLFTEGADVTAGDVLYEIDSSSYQAAYANAEAALAGAKANQTNAVAGQSRAQAAHANAKAALAGAKANQASAVAGQSRAQANHAGAKAALAGAKADHATALAARDAVKTALVAAKAAQSRAEANAAPLRLRVERFRELVASKAVSQQDFDDASAALKQAEAGIESAAAAEQGAEAEIVRAGAAIAVTEAQIQSAEAGIQATEAGIRSAEAAVQGAEAGVQSAEAGVQAAEAEIQSAAAAVQVAEATIRSAEAGLEAARINLGYTRITAPISGHIGRSAVTTGALVTAHQPVALATIQQLDPIYVDVPQATTELLRLRRRLAEGRLSHTGTGQNAVKLALEDGTAYPVEGTLEFRDVSVDPTTGSFIVRMVFPNPDRTLLPGMFVRAGVTEGVNDRAILIPQQAVTRNPKGDPLAMVVDASGVAQARMLTLDRALGDQWLVTSGLAAGDHVIVEGLQRVRPGAPVREVPLGAGGKENASPEKAPQPAPKAK